VTGNSALAAPGPAVAERVQPPRLLADRARRCRRESRCALCGRPILVGMREARLPAGELAPARWAHVLCVVTASKVVPATGGGEQEGTT
jgi:hypothetical protein